MIGDIDDSLDIDDMAAEVRIEQPVTVFFVAVPVEVGTVGREFHRGVKAIRRRIADAKTLDRDQVWIVYTSHRTFVAPDFDSSTYIGDDVDAIDQQQGATVDLDIAPVEKEREQTLDEITVIVFGMLLPDQHFTRPTVPCARPILIGPANTEWKIRFATL